MRYLRSTSPLLFAAVLACSSFFYQRQAHAALLSSAHTLLDSAIVNGDGDVTVVQSLMILTYWKVRTWFFVVMRVLRHVQVLTPQRPSDRSAWRKIGIALRTAYQLFWHVPRLDPLPEDEMRARNILVS